MLVFRAFGIWLIVWLTAFVAPANSGDFSKPGPFAVGWQAFTVDDVTGLHPLKSRVWYPAADPASDTANTPASSIKNAAPATSGPFPLVVVIHGLSGAGISYQPLGELLASYGFVVVASDYDYALMNRKPDPGVSTADMVQVRLIFQRPANVMRTIAEADAMTVPGGTLAGLIDTSRIGIFGHSTGGTTGLQAGGARIDFPELADWCAANKTERFGGSCQFLFHESAIAAAFGAQDPLAGALPPRWDSRVAALVLAAPGDELQVFGPTGIAAVKVPALIMFSSTDDVVRPDINALWAYDGIGSKEKALAVFDAGGHNMFVNAVPQFDEAAALTTAFFLSVLKGDKAGTAALLPGAASFPGMTYKTTFQ